MKEREKIYKHYSEKCKEHGKEPMKEGDFYGGAFDATVTALDKFCLPFASNYQLEDDTIVALVASKEKGASFHFASSDFEKNGVKKMFSKLLKEFKDE